jgi:hypothetical protein
VLDITRERRPPHYHVALFPQAYRDYLESLVGAEAVAAALEFPEPAPAPETPSKTAAPQAVPPIAAAAAAAQTGEGGPDALMTVLAVLPWLVVPIALLWRRRRERGACCGDLS